MLSKDDKKNQKLFNQNMTILTKYIRDNNLELSQDFNSRERQLHFLALYYSKGCNITETCKAVGVARQQFYYWSDTYPDFKTLAKMQEESLVDFAESKLLEAMQDGNIPAIKFFLCNKGRGRGWQPETKIEAQVNNDITIRYDYGDDERKPPECQGEPQNT